MAGGAIQGVEAQCLETSGVQAEAKGTRAGQCSEQLTLRKFKPIRGTGILSEGGVEEGIIGPEAVGGIKFFLKLAHCYGVFHSPAFGRLLKTPCFLQKRTSFKASPTIFPFMNLCISWFCTGPKAGMQKHHEKMQLEHSWHDVACGSREMGNLIGLQTCSADSRSASSWISI